MNILKWGLRMLPFTYMCSHLDYVEPACESLRRTPQFRA